MNTDPADPRCPHCGCDEDHSRSFGLWKCGTSQKNTGDRGSKCHITELRRENESLRERLAAYEATKHNEKLCRPADSEARAQTKESNVR